MKDIFIIVVVIRPSADPPTAASNHAAVNKYHKIKVVLVHPDSLLEGIEAVNKSKLPSTSIVLIRAPDSTTNPKAADIAKNYRTLDDVIAELQTQDLPTKRSLTHEEAKKKTAFFIFSSGTTGLPKAVQIPHYSLVSNV
jgi:long-subunit acyl-CoA synthetase (AMP-forming)